MAKSFTLLSNDLANALRLNTLSKEAPQIIELNKLFETLEKLLKKPLDPIYGETMLNEYYNKLSKLTHLLNSLNKREVITVDTDETLNSSNSSNSSSTITTPSKSSTISSGFQQPKVSVIQQPKASVIQQPITSVIQQPIASSTPNSNTIFQTPQNTNSVISSPPPSTINVAQSPIPTNFSPKKQQLLSALHTTDSTFAYDPTTKQIQLKGKKYDLTEFNSLFSKLRDADSNWKKSKTLSTSEKEMFDIIKNTLTQRIDGASIINNLPGLKKYFNDLTPKAKTRKQQLQQQKKQSPLISINSPVSTFRQAGRSQSAGPIARKKLTNTTGSGNPLGATKINFRRWEDFIKYEFIFFKNLHS